MSQDGEEDLPKKIRSARKRPGQVSHRSRIGGRALKEFRPLRSAEHSLLRAVAKGDPAVVSSRRPGSAKRGLTVRASFVRFLALGGDEEALVHEKGIALVGAFVKGPLDLRGCTVKAPLIFLMCNFEKTIVAIESSLKHIAFIETTINGLLGDSMKVEGSFLFRAKCKCFGELRLLGASIGTAFDISDSRFYANNKVCFGGDRLTTGGSFNAAGMRCLGEFRLTNVSIGGAADLRGAIAINRWGPAVTADGLRVRDDASFSEDFRAVGEVRFLRGIFGGDLDCERATFRNPGGIAFNARSVKVERGLFWRALFEVRGAVSLDSAAVLDLVDDLESWLQADDLILDGFTYGRLAGGSRTDAPSRIRWLQHSKPELYGGSFWPQPWEQAAHVLRGMGHVEDARLIAIELQRVMRREGVIGSRQPKSRKSRAGRSLEKLRVGALNWFARRLHLLYGALAGYGYRPMRTLGWMALIWAVSTGIDAWAYPRNLFVPKAIAVQPAEMVNSQYKRTSFSPAVFALDVMLPLVDLKQESEWTPAVERIDGTTNWLGWWVRALMWFEIIFGWLASLLLVAAVGRLVQKD